MKSRETLVDLHEKGLKYTPQREMILSVISRMEGHLSAKAILDEVRKTYPYLNKSVVYRTLNLFAEMGVLDAVDTGKGYIEYEKHDHPHHHHLTCRGCGRTFEMDEEIVSGFANEIKERYRFTPSLKQFAVTGFCRRCSTRRGRG